MAARDGAPGKGRVLCLGVRAAGSAAPDLVADPALAPGLVHPGQRARLGVPARALPARRGFRRGATGAGHGSRVGAAPGDHHGRLRPEEPASLLVPGRTQLPGRAPPVPARSEEHTSELQSHLNLVCRLLLEKKKKKKRKKKKLKKKKTKKTKKKTKKKKN